VSAAVSLTPRGGEKKEGEGSDRAVPKASPQRVKGGGGEVPVILSALCWCTRPRKGKRKGVFTAHSGDDGRRAPPEKKRSTARSVLVSGFSACREEKGKTACRGVGARFGDLKVS